MQDESLNPTQFRIAWYILMKHRWTLAAFVFLTTAVVALGSVLATPIFTASSRVLIKPGREDIYGRREARCARP